MYMHIYGLSAQAHRLCHWLANEHVDIDSFVKVAEGRLRKSSVHPNFPASCTCGVYLSLQAVHKRGFNSLIRSPDSHSFAGPWVTSVGSTTGDGPEVAASLTSPHRCSTS